MTTYTKPLHLQLVPEMFVGIVYLVLDFFSFPGVNGGADYCVKQHNAIIINNL